MYKYPYGDSQQLNLDWILAKLKKLEASGGSGGADLEEVSNALISLTYNTSAAYRRYDYAFRNGKLYRCLSDTSGVFDPPAWQEALIGDDLAVLTRWINAIDAAAVVDVKFDTTGTNGKIQQKYHDQYHDVVEVDYTPVQNSKRPLSSNAGYELNGAINAIGTVPIAVAKGGTGANNVRDAQINLSTLSVYQLNRTQTLTVDISEYNACMFVYFGKYGDEPLFKMFGSNGGAAVYKSFDDGGASSDLTVTSNNGILSVKAPNYCDGVACQVFPFTRKFTINVS